MVWAIVRVGALVFIVYYVFTDPAGAANSVHALLDGAKSAGNSLSQFANHL